MFLLSSILENSHIGYLRNTAEVLPFQISFFWTTDSLFIPFIALCCLWWWIFYSSSSMSRIHVKFSIIVLIFFLFGSVLPGNYSSWCGWNEVEIVTNSFLSNYLNKIHPPLFFIVFSFTLFCKFTPPSTIQRFYPIKLLNTIMLAAFLTMLGGWWAFQEGTWGGWWNWDSSEVLALVLGLISVFFLHFYTIHHLFSKELALEAWKCDIWSLPPPLLHSAAKFYSNLTLVRYQFYSSFLERYFLSYHSNSFVLIPSFQSDLLLTISTNLNLL